MSPCACYLCVNGNQTQKLNRASKCGFTLASHFGFVISMYMLIYYQHTLLYIYTCTSTDKMYISKLMMFIPHEDAIIVDKKKLNQRRTLRITLAKHISTYIHV